MKNTLLDNNSTLLWPQYSNQEEWTYYNKIDNVQMISSSLFKLISDE